MSAEANVDIVPDGAEEKTVDPMLVKIREQRAISSAVSEYITARDSFDRANDRYTKSCQAVRDSVNLGTQLVVRVDYGKHYLLTRDNNGFALDAIEVI